MTPSWEFYRWRTGPRQRDPIQGEFFATEAIRDPSEALVREGTQNTLDAAASDDGVDQTLVRITLSTATKSAKAAEIAPFFRGVWPHVTAKGSGLRPDTAPTSKEDCPFLLFEDFGTTGLIGDETQVSDTDEPNPFYFFFRAENRSAKTGDSRGRWGVGKQVFPRASRANLIFGYTVRRDDKKRLLMGSAVLKSHHIADDAAFYMPDGFFGHRREDDLVLPIEDSGTLDAFAKAFALTRRSDQPGTSIVVPWLSDEITFDAVLDAAIAGYFWPILNQQLTVELRHGDSIIVIDHERLPDLVARMRPETRALVALAGWAAAVKPKDEIPLPAQQQGKPVWGEDSVPATALAAIKDRLASDRRVSIKIPIWVRLRNSPDSWAESCFRVFLEEARDTQTRPTFARDGIIVTAAALPSPLVGMRALVVIDHTQLANMLGDAETPAHTQWQAGYLKGRYFYGAETIKFVRSAAHELVARLRAQDTESDKTWLASFFPMPGGTDDEAQSHTRKKRGDATSPEEIKLPPRPVPPYAIERVKGGFVVMSGMATPTFPLHLEVQVAYAVREGNALSEWEPEDFQMVYPPLRIDPKPVGLKVIEQGGKRMLLEVQTAPFRIDVVGFDTKRDLYVKVDVRKNNDPAN
ncbi:MAG: hypothetical protein RLZZ15_408 [Verrucomicrobiota bacterium]|jgi:hypothetical protein